jgi:hypothetical protein
MKNHLFSLLVLTFLPFSWGSAQVEPSLSKVLNSGSTENITVIARFRDRHPEFSVFKGEELRRYLMAEAKSAQAGFLDSLKARVASGAGIQRLQSLWICNSVILSASPEIIREISQRKDIESLLLDRTIKLQRPVSVSLAKGLEMRGTTWGLKNIKARKVWSELGITGKNITVGVLDTGWANHPELRGRVIRSKDFQSDYAENAPNDGDGHGSHVLGTIGGRALSGKSIGVAPDVNFIVGKIFDDTGDATESGILSAMQWITDPDGDPQTEDFPRVVSNSWGGSPGDMETERPWWDAVQTWRDLGIIPVFAAGNEGPDEETMSTPGGFPHALAIGATDEVDEIPEFSSRGPISWEGKEYIKPEISAPGDEILSIDHRGGYVKMSGTSMATPHVAGVIALLLQAYREIAVDQIEDVLKRTALDLGAEGLDNDSGYGRINAYEAVKYVMSAARVTAKVKGPSSSVHIKIAPGNQSYTIAAHASLSLLLPPGTHQITASSFGYVDQTIQIKVEATQIVEKTLVMEKAAFFKTIFVVKGSQGGTVDASLSFPEIPIPGGDTQSGKLERHLPKGRYLVRAKAKGHRILSQEFDTRNQSPIVLSLAALPPILVIDGDYIADYRAYYQASLEAVGMDADYGFVDKGEALSADLIQSYSTVIWYTGNSSQTLRPDQRTILKSYVENGGSLILTGQDVGFHLQNSAFYKQVCGAAFVADHSTVTQITGQGLDFDIEAEGGAGNQDWPDDILLVREGSEVFFKYKDEGPAAILNTVGEGKSLYLAFGFEGIPGVQTRMQAMRSMLDAIKPSLEQKLARIRWAYHQAPTLHSHLVRDFPIQRKNQNQIRNLLKSTHHKSPFKGLLARLLEIQH